MIQINIKGQNILINADTITLIKVVPLVQNKWGVAIDWLPKNTAVVKLNNEGYYETKQLAQAAKETFKAYVVENQTQGVDATVYKASGSLAPIYLTQEHVLKPENLGNVYNIDEQFQTTQDFVEGAGNIYPVGTNVVVVEHNGTVKFDTLSGILDMSAQNTGFDDSVTQIGANNVQTVLENIIAAMQWND